MDAGLNQPPDVAEHGSLLFIIESTGATPCIIDLLHVLLFEMVMLHHFISVTQKKLKKICPVFRNIYLLVILL